MKVGCTQLFVLVSRRTTSGKASTSRANRMNRKERLAARKEGQLDTAGFVKVADKFIDLANRENKNVNATQLHMAFLYGSTRYSAFVANSILKVDNHEAFVESMTKNFQEMLRQHLADDGISSPPEK